MNITYEQLIDLLKKSKNFSEYQEIENFSNEKYDITVFENSHSYKKIIISNKTHGKLAYQNFFSTYLVMNGSPFDPDDIDSDIETMFRQDKILNSFVIFDEADTNTCYEVDADHLAISKIDLNSESLLQNSPYNSFSQKGAIRLVNSIDAVLLTENFIYLSVIRLCYKVKENIEVKLNYSHNYLTPIENLHEKLNITAVASVIAIRKSNLQQQESFLFNIEDEPIKLYKFGSDQSDIILAEVYDGYYEQTTLWLVDAKSNMQISLSSKERVIFGKKYILYLDGPYDAVQNLNILRIEDLVNKELSNIYFYDYDRDSMHGYSVVFENAKFINDETFILDGKTYHCNSFF